MNKCLRIVVFGSLTQDFLTSFVQKTARKYDLEGTARFIEENQAQIVVCGEKDKVDEFLDMLHKGAAKWAFDDVEVEPFLRDKDYRGVFRIIE
jgi:acylphosphatase